MSNIVTYDRQGRSHFIPASRERSVIRQFADSISGGLATDAVRSSEEMFGAAYVKAFLSSVRQSGESAITGGLLGALKAAGIIEIGNIPVDLAGWAGGNALGIFFAKSEIGQTLRTMGSTSLGVFAYRQTERWFSGAKASVHGEADVGYDVESTADDMGSEDPIMAAAMAV